ncbi:MAG: hypothetical protein ABFD25_20935 [Clostridiaceae bacterium]
MLSKNEIAVYFHKGASKQGIVNLLITQAKTNKEKLSRYDALKLVEEAILEDYKRKSKGGVTVHKSRGIRKAA